ncbi:MAG: hypothetical protein HQL45_08670 [Alphaproteobacteria bacterium]|nr:hypothetical protein [Alphaproteobacteria bacterium]
MIKAINFYAEAKELFAPAASEARRRTLASRAYYAGYHFLLERGVVPTNEEEKETKSIHPNAGSHQRYLRWMGNSSNAQFRRAAVLLGQVYQHRIKADYWPSNTLTSEEAKDAMAVLEELIEETFI